MMAPLRSLAPLASLLALASAKSCPGDLPASCHNNTAIENTCCFVSAGLLAQTQFWDYDPSTGPSDSWTIHGLWPDWCDGSYPSTCDESRQYSNISDILSAGGADDTLSYMKKYWKDYEGDDETFWEHEWGKHGTCISTLDPDCFDDYKSTQEAVAYFKRTVSLFKSLPTYKWLADAGIKPSTSETYSLDKILSTLEDKHGAPVYVDCEGDNLNQVWYHFNVKGTLQDGKFQPADPTSKGSCPDEVSYQPKDGGGNFTAGSKAFHKQ